MKPQNPFPLTPIPVTTENRITALTFGTLLGHPATKGLTTPTPPDLSPALSALQNTVLTVLENKKQATGTTWPVQGVLRTGRRGGTAWTVFVAQNTCKAGHPSCTQSCDTPSAHDRLHLPHKELLCPENGFPICLCVVGTTGLVIRNTNFRWSENPDVQNTLSTLYQILNTTEGKTIPHKTSGI